MERMFKTNRILGKKYKLNDETYSIKNVLGEGGIGVVYEAINSNSEKICIKALNPREEYSSSYARIVERFYHEAEKGQEFDHTNIIDIFDIDKINDIHCYFMEYCEYGNLKNLLRNSGYYLDFKMKISIFFQICSGLNYIHKKGVHRDLKPDNILISRLDYDNIIIKISDFGTFYDITEKDQNPETKKNDKFGSLAYISPEQRKGKQVNCQTDIYSLGIILYQLLIEDTYEIRLKYENLGDYIDSNEKFILKNIIHKMCENDPRFRYKNINEVGLDLKNILKQKEMSYEKIKIPDWIKEKSVKPATMQCSANLLNELNLENMNYNKQLWSFNLSRVLEKDNEICINEFLEPTGAVIKKHLVITGWSSGHVSSVYLEKGNVNWYKKVSDNKILSTPVIYKNKCYVIDEFGKILCLDLYTGKVLWGKNLDNDCDNPLYVSEGKLIIITNENIIILFDIKQKNIVKEIEIEKSRSKYDSYINMTKQFDNGIALIYDEQIKVIPDLMAENIRGWSDYVPLVTENYLTPSFRRKYFIGMTNDRRNIYVTACNGSIVCKEIKNGSSVWKIETCEYPSIPFLYKDYMCFATDKGYLYMADKRNGSILKKTKINCGFKKDYISILPIITDSQVILFSEYDLRVIDKSSFKKIKSLYGWSTYYNTVPFEIDFKQPAFSYNIMILSGDDGIYAFDFNKDID